MNRSIHISAWLAVTCCLLPVRVVSADSDDDQIKKLQTEIQQLQVDIKPLEDPRLGSPGSVRVDLSAAPISRLFAYVDSLPPQRKEVSFVLTGSTGQLAHWEQECSVFGINVGSVAAWAEFESVGGGGFWLNLTKTAAGWNPTAGGLNLGIDLSAYAFIPTITTHLKPVCFLGAFRGPDIGPIAVHFAADSRTVVRLVRGNAQLFALDAPVHVNGSLEACISLGILGSLCIPYAITGDFQWTGDIGGPTAQTGSVTIPAGPGIIRAFSVDLTNRTPGTTGTGFRLDVQPSITWH